MMNPNGLLGPQVLPVNPNQQPVRPMATPNMQIQSNPLSPLPQKPSLAGTMVVDPAGLKDGGPKPPDLGPQVQPGLPPGSGGPMPSPGGDPNRQRLAQAIMRATAGGRPGMPPGRPMPPPGGPMRPPQQPMQPPQGQRPMRPPPNPLARPRPLGR